MNRTSWLIVGGIAVALWIVWRRSEADLAQAQARAAQITMENNLFNTGVSVARAYYGAGV